MKALIAIFLIFLFLLLIFLASRNLEIPKTGEFFMAKNETSEEKWRVVARVEILNGKIASLTKNLS